jgi:hypothetical protein
MDFGNGFWGTFATLLVATVPGVLIALFAQYLNQRRENQQARQLNANARALLALEIDANLAALRDFWQTINALDTEHQSEGAEAHLAGMAQNGLLGYSLPHWSSARWQTFPPQALAILSGAEIERVYRCYSDLGGISDLYTKVVTIPPEEMKEYTQGGSGSRFWYNYFAGNHVGAFRRLDALVSRVLSAGDPLGRAN